MCGLAPSRDPRRDPLRRRRLGRGDDPLPADRHGAGRDRHLAARPGPRDDVRRRSSPTGSASTIDERRGAARRHGGRRRSGWTPTAAAASPSAASRSGRRRDKIVDEGEADRGAPARGRRRPTSSTTTARSRRRDGQLADDEGDRARGLDGARPAGRHGARARGDAPSTTRRTSAGPAGTHIAVVEVDTETGSVDLRRYVAVDDVGNVINPMIVDGQIHGGIAQGVAQALFEEAVYDDDGEPADALDGQLHGARRRPSCPSFELDRTETPSPTNPLGVKGVGETGTIASPRGGDERRRRRALAATASPTSTCPPRPSESGGRSRRRRHDPRAVRLRGRRVGRARGRAARLARGREAARGRALADPAAAAARSRGRRCSSTSAGSTTLRYVRDDGDRLAIGALTRHADLETRSAAAGALPAASSHVGGPDRRPAGAPSRHDRRLARARRPGLRPADGRCSRSTRELVVRGPGGRADRGGGATSSAASSRPALGPQDVADRDPRAEARRRRLVVPEVHAPRAGLGDGRRRGARGVERRRRDTDRAHEHGPDAAAGARGRRQADLATAPDRRGRDGRSRRHRAARRHERQRRVPPRTWRRCSSGARSRRRSADRAARGSAPARGGSRAARSGAGSACCAPRSRPQRARSPAPSPSAICVALERARRCRGRARSA